MEELLAPLMTPAPSSLPSHPAPQAIAAFAKQWGLDDVKELLVPTRADLLARVMSYHLHEGGALRASQLRSGQKLSTLNGATLEVST